MWRDRSSLEQVEHENGKWEMGIADGTIRLVIDTTNSCVIA